MQRYSPPYVTILSSQECNAPSLDSSSTAQQPANSSSFFDCLKSFVQRPLSRSRSPRRSPNSDKPTSECSALYDIDNARQISPSKSKPRVLPVLRHNRGRVETPSPHDYLTLEQLEAVWQEQDTHGEYIDRPWDSDQCATQSTSSRGRQLNPLPYAEIHPALRPRYSHTQTSTHRDFHHMAVSAD